MNTPRPQTCVQLADPGADVVPLGQPAHCVEPAAPEYFPAGHKVHAAAPPVDENVPGWQYSHAALPTAGADVPAEQDKQEAPV